MLVGGLRALLVQALEPRAMAAVDQHSKFREDPWGRLERTTQLRARHDLRRHRSRRGGGGAGAHGARAHPRRRSRHRAELLAPTIPTCCSGSTRSRSTRSCSRTARTPGGCPRADADRYVAEMARVAEMVELPAAMAPRTEGELRDYLRSVRGLQITPAARRRAARRPVPADAPRVPAAVGDPDDGRGRDPARLRAADVPASLVPGRRSARARRGVRAQPGMLNLRPRPPAVEAALQRMRQGAPRRESVAVGQRARSRGNLPDRRLQDISGVSGIR